MSHVTLSRFNHKEAFALMWYQDEKTGERVRLWNSRDGVTPFTIMSPAGNPSSHVDFQHDVYTPGHVPAIGDRVFVDLTIERAREYRREYVDKWWDATVTGGAFKMSQRVDLWTSKDEAVEYLAQRDIRPPEGDLAAALVGLFTGISTSTATTMTASAPPDIIVVDEAFLAALETSRMPVVPEVDLPAGVVEERHFGSSWYLNLSDGRVLRLSEVYEGQFTVEDMATEPDEREAPDTPSPSSGHGMMELLTMAARGAGILRGTGRSHWEQDPEGGFWWLGEDDYDGDKDANVVCRAIFIAEALAPEGAVARDCEARDIPVYIVPAISNRLGPDGPGTWTLSKAEAAEIALVALPGAKRQAF